MPNHANLISRYGALFIPTQKTLRELFSMTKPFKEVYGVHWMQKVHWCNPGAAGTYLDIQCCERLLATLILCPNNHHSH